jgi:hypothetical protein
VRWWVTVSDRAACRRLKGIDRRTVQPGESAPSQDSHEILNMPLILLILVIGNAIRDAWA